MAPQYIPLATFIILSLIQLTFSINCGSLTIKCNTGEPNCYQGLCANFAPHFVNLNRLPFKQTPHPTILIISPRPTNQPQPSPTPQPTPLPTNPPPTTPISPPNPSPAPQPIEPTRTSCNGLIRCPCPGYLQCFEQRFLPNCECECPLSILIREIRGDPFLCGRDNPGQVYDHQACACKCPAGSDDADDCAPDEIFDARTCKCLSMFVKIPTTSTTATPRPTIHIIPAPQPLSTSTLQPVTAIQTTQDIQTPSPTVSIIQTTTNSPTTKNPTTAAPTRVTTTNAPTTTTNPPVLATTEAPTATTTTNAPTSAITTSTTTTTQAPITATIVATTKATTTTKAPTAAKTTDTVTEAATTKAATTKTPTTAKFTTEAPTVEAITTTTTTKAPITKSPTTKSPTTGAPITKTPTTTTTAPTTKAPTTKEPTTKAPAVEPTLSITLQPIITTATTKAVQSTMEPKVSSTEPVDDDDNVCPMDITSNMDIILLVDDSCGLSLEDCRIRQKGISEFVSSINGARIGYISYINGNRIKRVYGLNSFSRISMEDINRFDCGKCTGSYSADIVSGIGAGIKELALNIEKGDENGKKKRKIVIFNNCHDILNDGISIARLNDELMIEGENIEITVVNIPCINQSPHFDINSLKPLTNNNMDRFIMINSITIQSFKSALPQFIRAICPITTTPKPQTTTTSTSTSSSTPKPLITTTSTTSTTSTSISPTSMSPTKIATLTPTTSTGKPTEATCPKLGEECTSELKRAHRCCDGHRGGSLRCKWTHYDLVGNKIGKCCIRKNFKGCRIDSDCCGNNRFCFKGYCLRHQRNENKALIITKDGKYAEWANIDDDDGNGEIFGLSRGIQIIIVIVIIICLLSNITFFCLKYYRKNKNNNNARDNDYDDDDEYFDTQIVDMHNNNDIDEYDDDDDLDNMEYDEYNQYNIF